MEVLGLRFYNARHLRSDGDMLLAQQLVCSLANLPKGSLERATSSFKAEQHLVFHSEFPAAFFLPLIGQRRDHQTDFVIQPKKETLWKMVPGYPICASTSAVSVQDYA